MPAGAAAEDPPFVPAMRPIALSAEVATAAAAVAAACSASPAEVFLAAWQVVLWRLAGGAEMVVGVAFEGRRFAELAGALGLFARDLPVTVRLDEVLPFAAVVERLHRVCADHHDWQEYWAPQALPGGGAPQASPAGEAPGACRRTPGCSRSRCGSSAPMMFVTRPPSRA